MEEEERNRLVLSHLPLVRRIARAMHPALPPSVDIDDLIQAGSVGLIDAAQRFQVERGLQFKTYAEKRIRGTILDSLREVDWASRNHRHHLKRIRAAVETFTGRMERKPDSEELATELGMSLENFRKFRRKIYVYFSPLEELRNVADRGWEPADELASRRQLAARLAQLMEHLPERTARIIRLYFWEEKRMWEIAEIIGVNESRVCQILKKALGRLAMKLG